MSEHTENTRMADVRRGQGRLDGHATWCLWYAVRGIGIVSGYHLVLPYAMNQQIWDVMGEQAFIDLSQEFNFVYQGGSTSRKWEIAKYDEDGESRMEDGRYIYRILPFRDGEQEISVQLGIYNEEGMLVPSAEFDIAGNLYTMYRMTQSM